MPFDSEFSPISPSPGFPWVGGASTEIIPIGGSAFRPSDIAGLALWLDGSDGGTMFDAVSDGSPVANHGAVARWEDKSGNGRHFTQSTAGSRPLFVSGSGVVFDGTDDTLSSSWSLDQPITEFVVYASSSGNVFAKLTSSSGGGIELISFDFVSGSGVDTVIAGGTIVQFTPSESLQVLRVHWNASDSAAFRNGAELQTGDPGAVGVDGTEWLASNSGGSGFLACSIRERILYDTILSAELTAAVESYLFAKWGITP